MPQQATVNRLALPEGYDARCDWCRQPYTYSNSMACNTVHHNVFCSSLCEEEETESRKHLQNGYKGLGRVACVREAAACGDAN